MDVGLNGCAAPPNVAQHSVCAEDILFNWLLRMPLDADPADAAGVVLAAAPARAGETPLQSRLRGLLVEVSRSPRSVSQARPIRRRR